jgi:hypothetical protein
MYKKYKRVFYRWNKAIAVTLTSAVMALNGSPAWSQSKQLTPPRQAEGCKLVFEDQFDRNDVGSDGAGVHTWYEGVWWYHKHAPLSNVSTTASVLSLKWLPGQEATDTSISTLSRNGHNFAAWRYGYFEARMRWDVVRGAWPAFWLIPAQDAQDKAVYNGTKETGEIDIFEGQGDHPHTFYGTIHDWVNLHDHASKNNAFELTNNVDFSEFHVYGLLWTPGKITWYLDNKPLHSESTPAIFDQQDFFLVLGMAAGEDWKAGNLSGDAPTSMTLNVDWVRVWQK